MEYSCKKQGRHCGPGCHCINCSNGTDLPSKRVTDLEVENIVQEHQEEGTYVDDSDDTLTDLMRDDEELEEVTEQQFDESDQELEIQHHCAVVYVHMYMLNLTVLRNHPNQGYTGWCHFY